MDISITFTYFLFKIFMFRGKLYIHREEWFNTLTTPNESCTRKSLRAHRASRDVACSPLSASQCAGSLASSVLVFSFEEFSCLFQSHIVALSEVRPSMYLNTSKNKDLNEGPHFLYKCRSTQYSWMILVRLPDICFGMKQSLRTWRHRVEHRLNLSGCRNWDSLRCSWKL